MVAKADKAETNGKRRERTLIPLHTRMKVRNLYLTQSLPYKTIADKVGLRPDQIRTLIQRENWFSLKNEAKRKADASADAHVTAQVQEIVEAVASESEEIALAGLQRAREATESTSEFAAKDFQSWTGGVRNLVNIARQARGLDAERAPGQGATLNVFVGRYETVGQSSAKPNTAPIDVTATEVKPAIT